MLRRFVLLAAVLLVTASAHATYYPAFSSNYVTLTAGETTTIQVWAAWTGFSGGFEFNGWEFASQDPSVALVEGRHDRLGTRSDVRITAISGGKSLIRQRAPNGNLFGGPYVEIFVTENLSTVTIGVSAPSLTNQPVTLTLLNVPPTATWIWYQGEPGDRRTPMGNTRELTFIPTTAGRHAYWVDMIAPGTSRKVSVAVEVVAPPTRRRSVRH